AHLAAPEVERRRRRRPLLDHAVHDGGPGGHGQARQLLQRLLDLPPLLARQPHRRDHRPLWSPPRPVSVGVPARSRSTHSMRPSIFSLVSNAVATSAAPPAAAASIHSTPGSRANHVTWRLA